MKLSNTLLLLAVLCAGTGIAEAQKAPKRAKAAKDSVSLNLTYRNVIRDNYNGSAYTVYGEGLRNTATTYLTETLSGIVPGLATRQSSGGLANGNASYWIRGIRTFNEGVLVLIDGQERAFGALTMDEVESITVLKDAAATGIYGMRAASGAILVTTRKGTAGAPKTEFTIQMMNQSPIGRYEPLSAAEYASHYNTATIMDGLQPKYSAYDLSMYRSGKDPVNYADVDWLGKYMKNNWWSQRYNLSVSGGAKNATYFVNLGYIHQPGMFNTDSETNYNTNNYADRYNFRSNIAVNVDKTTKLNVDIYGWYKVENQPGTSASALYGLLVTTPANAFPEYYLGSKDMVDQDGNLITTFNNKLVAGTTYNANPWARLNRNGYSRTLDMYGSLRASLQKDLSKILRGLSAEAVISMDSETVSTIGRTKAYAYYTPIDTGKYNKTGADGNITNTVSDRSGVRRTTINARLAYNRTIEKHGISASAFYEQYESTRQTGIASRVQGVYGYASYNYDKRYGIDVTAAYHGWYGFAPGHKFGFFPTVAAGWTISNEKFMQALKPAVSFLKVRASYGEIGSSRGIDDFGYMSYMTKETGVFVEGNAMNSNRAGYYEGQIANASLTWENAKQMNIGLDLRMFNDRLTVVADYFTDERTNIYTTNSRVSTLMGLNSNVVVKENIGAMNSNGYEIAAQWSDKIGDLSYTFGGNYFTNENTITANGAVDEKYEWLSAINRFYGCKIGYQVEGIFQSYEEIAAHATQSWSTLRPGDLKYRDVNGDGVIDSDDRVPLGYSNYPQIYYGFNFGVGYHGFKLSVLFQGAARVSHSLDAVDKFAFVDYGTIYSNQTDYWTPENNTSATPRLTTLITSSNNSQTNSLSIVDADYLRLKRVEFSYDFSSKLFAKSFVNGMRLFVTGYNLFTWTDYKYGDPEASTNASALPVNRNISLGCSLIF